MKYWQLAQIDVLFGFLWAVRFVTNGSDANCLTIKGTYHLMASKTQIKIAYGLAIYFLFIGFLSYAVFSAETPESPIRVMYKTATGKVLFDHKTHAGDEGYGLACKDCHHHPMEDDADLRSCGECHTRAQEESMPESCLDCHEADEVEDTEMTIRGDAFHQQCIGCHEEFGKGPVDSVDCTTCHVK